MKSFINIWCFFLFVISLASTRGADGNPGLFFLGYCIVGLCYFVKNLKVYKKVEKVHVLHMFSFTVAASIPLLATKLDGMSGMLIFFIPIAAFLIVFVSVIALLLKEYFHWY